MDSISNIIKNQTKTLGISQKKNPKKEASPKALICYLGLGSNIGDSTENLNKTIDLIASVKDIKLLKVAKYYVTKAWGKTNQQDFINTAVKIQTTLLPQQLLVKIQRIEKDLGRKRVEKWGPRIIDIDILVYGDYVVKQQHLQIPHPHITTRAFVLAPLLELNSQLSIPLFGLLSSYLDDEMKRREIIEVN